MTELHAFLLGSVATLCIVAGLFFVRYWRTTRDRFFLGFAFAFGLLAVNWSAVAVAHPSTESRHWVYVIRLIAFLLILVSIVQKNRRKR